jgi:hypothetical protein
MPGVSEAAMLPLVSSWSKALRCRTFGKLLHQQLRVVNCMHLNVKVKEKQMKY